MLFRSRWLFFTGKVIQRSSCDSVPGQIKGRPPTPWGPHAPFPRLSLWSYVGGSAPAGTKRSSCPSPACFILSPMWPNSLSWEHTGWSCRLAAHRPISGWAGLPGGRARRVLTTKCEGLALGLGGGGRGWGGRVCELSCPLLPGRACGPYREGHWEAPAPRRQTGVCSSLREAWAQGIKEVC